MKNKNKWKKKAQDFVNNVSKEQQKIITNNLEKEFLKHKLKLTEEQKGFQTDLNTNVSKIAQLNEDVYLQSKENKKMIDTLQKDLSETKLKGIRLRRSITRNLLLAFGVINLFLAFLIVINNITTQLNLDMITAATIVSLIRATTIYLSTNI